MLDIENKELKNKIGRMKRYKKMAKDLFEHVKQLE